VRLLLDTHALLWWLDGDRRLSLKARRAIASESNSILVSAVSAWEITTKARLGKLPGATDVAALSRKNATIITLILEEYRRHPKPRRAGPDKGRRRARAVRCRPLTATWRIPHVLA
jgi:hypothetical protein